LLIPDYCSLRTGRFPFVRREGEDFSFIAGTVILFDEAVLDKAFKPPAEAAMAMTGNEQLTGKTGVVSQTASAGSF
jgi:hypothetical protein